MSATETQVIIVGGGVAGSSLACALAHKGIHSILFERSKNSRDLNRGDGLQPRSLEIMETWGVLKTFVEAGAIPSYGNEVHHPIFGKLLEVDLGVVNTQYPYMLNLPHPQIEELLTAHAENSGYCQVLYGDVKEVLFENNQAIGVRAVVNKEEVVIKAPVVAGADGSKSFLRKCAEIETTFEPYDHDMIVLHTKRPHWFTGRFRTKVFLHQEGPVVLLPLPDNKIRVVCLIKVKTGGTWIALSKSELHRQLIRRLPSLADVELEQHGEHIYRIQKMHAKEYANKGIVLLGDAAHVTHPAAGQGMNMALQDAEILAKQLQRAFSGECSLDNAYTTYESIRRPLNQSVINRAHYMAWLIWSPSILGFLDRTLRMATLRFLFPFKYQQLTRSLAWGISGIQQP